MSEFADSIVVFPDGIVISLCPGHVFLTVQVGWRVELACIDDVLQNDSSFFHIQNCPLTCCVESMILLSMCSSSSSFGEVSSVTGKCSSFTPLKRSLIFKSKVISITELNALDTNTGHYTNTAPVSVSVSEKCPKR